MSRMAPNANAFILICLFAAGCAPSQPTLSTAASMETASPSTPTPPPAATAAPSPQPTPEPTEIALPSDYKFVFQGQTPEFEATVRAGILRGYRWLRAQGVTDTGPFTLFIIADRDQWVKAMEDYFQMPEDWTKARISYGNHYGAHGPGWITRWAGGALWELGQLQGIIGDFAPEYIQGSLLQLAGLHPTDTLNDYVPNWLVAGSEKYLSARECDVYQPGCFAARHASGISEARIHSSYMTGNLASAELGDSSEVDSGEIGFYGLEYMFDTYGGDQKLIEWFRSLKTRQPGDTWRDVFQRVYGVSVSQFYADFDAYRAVHYPRTYGDIEGFVQGTISHADNGPIQSSIWVFVCPPNPVYDCVPTQALRGYHSSTDTWDPVWDWFVESPMKIGDALDVKIYFAHTADPASVFGYYSGESGFTTDPAQASVIHLKSGDKFDTGLLDLPAEFLPPTVTPTAVATP